jgi:hypothetical protein
MTLEQTTQAVLAAIESEDLGALARAIEDRAAALGATPQPNPGDFEAGERACRALEALKRRWAGEDSRLHQLQTGLVDASAPSSVVVRG